MNKGDYVNCLLKKPLVAYQSGREWGGGLNLANADVLFREGGLKCRQVLTVGRGVAKIIETGLTYFMDGP